MDKTENAKKMNPVLKLTLSAMFLAAGLLLPLLTGQIKQIGNMLLPMHIPVIMCGLICGWKYGLGVGFITPLLRSVLFSMPPMYPQAVAMAFELATYGLVVGLLYGRSKWKCIISLYRSMIIAMLAGRVVWGVAMVFLLGLGENGFTWQAFLAGAFLNAFPGIILQLVFIPAMMLVLNKTGLVKFSRHHKKPMENSEG
ncbi:MAG: ECF transporter S component [Lachnospiraceae bacterium]|nr:ECF transporter S component [Ruminococcus sp.]MCM1276157.1 ECF transporter S component [Lachnospiraceae bacterium]